MNMEYKLIKMSDIQPKPVKFLWEPYIPMDMLSIIQGNPGLGKTMLALSIVADLSNGKPLPGEQKPREPINIIYQTREDLLDKTIRPRLDALGADCSKITIIDESDQDLCLTDERIERALLETHAKLIILDPLQSYIGNKVDFHRANEVRPVLSKLSKLAEKYSCAVVMIGHLNKSSSQQQCVAFQGLGSIDIFAAVRSVLLVGKSYEDEETRMLFHAKSNVSKPGVTLTYKIDDKKAIYTGTTDLTADQFARDGGINLTKVEAAKAFLINFLGDGEKTSAEIMEAAEQEDFCLRTLKTAKQKLNIKSYKTDDKWYWQLP